MYPEEFVATMPSIIEQDENEARRQRNREEREHRAQRKLDNGLKYFCIGFVIGMALIVIFY